MRTCKQIVGWAYERWAIIALYLMLILLLVGMASGCSAVKSIAASVNQVRTEATSIRGNVAEARKNLDAGNIPGVQNNLTSIDSSATLIQEQADKVTEKLTEVQDKTPWWAGLMKWGFVAVAVAGVIFLAWRLNIFILIENTIGRIVGAIAKWAV